MFRKNDIRQLKTFGIKPETIEEQLQIFRRGINYPKIDRAASVGDGIVRLDDDERCRYTDTWAQYLTDDRHRAVKFVPASGAASRMFKDLFEYIEKEEPTQFVGKFFNDIEFFAFYDLLDGAQVRPRLDIVVPYVPYRQLFTDAWQRYHDGDIPGYQELRTERYRRR